ncbi:hypothetical protein CC80DRAFT_488666 [Byssothecium circinans]|uniref:Inhibitor I9 domain-containing protein n=1 Tax=Byssothecium circinans TaxID=147558 RepID=A0A6A5UEQ0_9PLEO|nr:hypothetical protein CC80DRAFT_488666 [Byssothecium circinans]
MRFTLFSLIVAALFAMTTLAVAPMHSVIISFPKEAPDSLLQSAKDQVVAAKGKITHEYNIIKGFAAELPKSAMETIQTLSAEFPALIESDGVVTTQGEKKAGIF